MTHKATRTRTDVSSGLTRPRGGACVLFAVCVWALATPSLAINGRADVRSTHQEGQAGALAYKASSLREIYSLGQHVQFGPGLQLRIDAQAQRESLISRSLQQEITTERTTQFPGLTLSYRDDHVRVGLAGRATRTDQIVTGAADQRDEYLDLNFWFFTRISTVQLDLSAQETASWRYVQGGDRENREHSVNGTALWNLTSHDNLRYRHGRSRQEAVSQQRQTTFVTNNLQYRGDHRFLDDRAHIAVNAVTNHFRQRDRQDDLVTRAYVQPLWGGYAIDDSPEFLDPLEADPVEAARLLDNDRAQPTEVNLGDDAPVGREFGGDYRNVILDFGEAEEFVFGVLYVDRIVRFPALMQWRVYVSDDPEGRDWGAALGAADYEVRYQEWETGRQGWTVELRQPITHRRIKLVNIKLGPTEPDLFVTEFEMYTPAIASTPEGSSTVTNNRLNAEVGYELTSALSVRYATNLSERSFDDEERNLRGTAHTAGLMWHLGQWSLSGQYETHTLRGQSRRDTDSRSQSVSLSRNRRGTLGGRVSYVRTVDNSYNLGYETQSWSGDLNWQLAPLLTFTQRVAYGLRDDPMLAEPARSWVVVSELRGTPRPSLSVELRRADRWVDQEAGSGFTGFNDTEMSVNWSVLPLVQLSSQAIYQVRDRDDWFYRNSVTWTPLPGGSVLLRFQANDQQDTRTDYHQRGGGADLTWRPRPALNLAAGVEKSRVTRAGEKTSPLGYHFRANWTF